MTQQEREQLILDLAENRERLALHIAFQAGDLDEELQAIREKRNREQKRHESIEARSSTNR